MARIKFCFLATLAWIVCACSAPPMDGSSSLSQQAVIDQVNVYLNTMDCADAIKTIAPVYNSANTSNAIRMATATAYGCQATINFLNLTNNIENNASNLAGQKIWNTLAKFFPSTLGGTDKVVEAGETATDALEAVVNSGTVIAPFNLVNSGSFNPGSTLYTDRTSDANIYMLYTSMAIAGGIESRLWKPVAPNYSPTTAPVALFFKAVNVNTYDGSDSDSDADSSCAYASALLNMSDAITAISGIVPAALQSSISGLSTELNLVLTQACNDGLSGTAIYGTQSGCGLAKNGCPLSLRDRHVCAGTVTDSNSCAAVGISNFVSNAGVGGGWQ